MPSKRIIDYDYQALANRLSRTLLPFPARKVSSRTRPHPVKSEKPHETLFFTIIFDFAKFG